MRKLSLGLKTSLLSLFIWTLSSVSSLAQCAMCRATIEKNVNEGDNLSIASSLNLGIIYLFIMPYILFATVGYLWYRKSKKNKLQEA